MGNNQPYREDTAQGCWKTTAEGLRLCRCAPPTGVIVACQLGPKLLPASKNQMFRLHLVRTLRLALSLKNTRLFEDRYKPQFT